MSTPYTCLQGHQWPAESGASCPECGAAAIDSFTQELRTEAFQSAGSYAQKIIPVVERRGVAPPGYEVLEEIGRGGMGVVFKARQIGLKRLVALKMIRGGARASREDLDRFRLEAQAVAKLQHPHIVPIHEVGEHAGLPFIALEYIEGGSLQRKLAGQPQPGKEAARLIYAIAGAMQAAHEKGIIHRDLKPGNILLNTDGSPCVTDFGLAKQLEGDSGHTRSGAVIGTPSYMAPEQAQGNVKTLGPAADVYGLGAILYEMLTGRPPFKGPSMFDTLQQVRFQEPVPPSRLQPKCSRDLETICLKCLEKDPRRRYASAADLADDLGRFLDGLPILARPTSMRERAWKWARRRPSVAALLLVAFISLIYGYGAMSLTWRQALAEGELARAAEKTANDRADAAETAREIAQQARAEADLQIEQTRKARAQVLAGLYANHVNLADTEWEAEHVQRAADLLDRCAPALCRWEWFYLKRRFHGEALTLPGFNDAAFSPDNLHLAWLNRNGAISIRNHGTGQTRSFAAHAYPLGVHLTYNGDGTLLASSGADKVVKVWQPDTGKCLHALPHAGTAVGVAFRPNGEHLASTCLDGKLRVWDLKTGKLVWTHEGRWIEYSGLTYSADGKYLATTEADNAIKLLDPNTGQVLRTFSHPNPVYDIAFSPDSAFMIVGRFGQASLWDVPAGKVLRHYRTHSTWVTRVAYSPNGARIAAAGYDGVLKVFDAADGRNLVSLRGHTDRVVGLSFSPDGLRLASAGKDMSIRLWDLTSTTEARTLRSHIGQVTSLAFSPDGKHLVSGGTDETVKVWGVGNWHELRSFHMHKHWTTAVAYSPDGKRLVSTGGTPEKGVEVKVWQADTGKVLFDCPGHKNEAMSVAFSPDGARMATADMECTKVWDANDGKLLHTLDKVGQRVAISPDSKLLATISVSKRLTIAVRYDIKIWDLGTGQERLTLTGFQSSISSLSFSPNGKNLLAAGGNWTNTGEMRIWDLASGKEIRDFRGHRSQIMRAAYHPHLNRVASGSVDGTVKIWDLDKGRELITLRGHRRGILAVAFDRTGDLLASASADGTVKIWDGSSFAATRTLRGHTGLSRVTFSPDGQALTVGGRDGSIIIWDAQTYEDRLLLRGHQARIRGVSFSRDGRRLFSADVEGHIKVWDLLQARELTSLSQNKELSGMVCSHDGQWIASAGSGADTVIRLWNAEDGSKVREFAGHTAYLMSLAFSPDDTRLASVGGDKVVRIWDTSTGVELRALPFEQQVVNAVTYSPDGRLVAAAGSDGAVRVWDADTGAVVTTYQSQSRLPVYALSFSPDSSLIASAGWETVINLWNARTGQTLKSYWEHTDSVTSLAFSPDGKRLASNGRDETLIILDLPQR